MINLKNLSLNNGNDGLMASLAEQHCVNLSAPESGSMVWLKSKQIEH